MTSTPVRAGGCHVYGLVRDDGAPLPDVAGVAGAPLRAISAGGSSGLAAIVSDAPPDGQGYGRSDLLAHSDVLQALVAERDVVPVRFGSVYPSDEVICGELLAPHLGALRRILQSVAGMVEMQVKVAYAEMTITAEIVGSDRRIRKLRDAARAAPGDQAVQIELGRRFASALEARREADRRSVSRRLDRLAAATAPQESRGDYAVGKIACLVPRARLDRFDAELARLDSEHSGRLTFTVLGPLPPYSFVAGTLPEGR